MSELVNQCATVVTGAASGIGASLSEMLNDDQTPVIGVDVQEMPGTTDSLRCDLSCKTSINACLAAMPEKLGGFAAVAGVPGTAPIDVVLMVNFFGLRHLLEGCIGKLTDGASIVLVSSIAAHRSPLTDNELDHIIDCPMDEGLKRARRHCADGKGAYELSKRLVLHWMQALTFEGHKRGIRVNAVSPGPTKTPILQDFENSMGADRIQLAADLAGRHAAPAEIASAIRFLLRDEASWVNGIELPVDGGFHTLRSHRHRLQETTSGGQ